MIVTGSVPRAEPAIAAAPLTEIFSAFKLDSADFFRGGSLIVVAAGVEGVFHTAFIREPAFVDHCQIGVSFLVSHAAAQCDRFGELIIQPKTRRDETILRDRDPLKAEGSPVIMRARQK